ncbi:hypothetical protein HDV05_005472 [Chytridiales sp. JEL 0842]|nr:hypothetical protein HDV05_005472 [Chytridiales sp. JEL 0842]
MDGNRRFARTRGMHVSKGHTQGFHKLEETLDWCLSLGVKMVTTFAFSTENFKRDPDEVRLLMDLAKEKFEEFATKSDLIAKYGIAIRIFGDVSLLPIDVQLAASRAVFMTRKNTNAILNICIPYTSREEIALAMRSVVEAVELGDLLPTDVCEELIELSLFTGGCPPVDMIVRTSGEVRLSDFLLWQASDNCHIHFVDALWPDFSFWDMLSALLKYQMSYYDLQAAREEIETKREYLLKQNVEMFDEKTIERMKRYLEKLHERRDAEAVALALANMNES